MLLPKVVTAALQDDGCPLPGQYLVFRLDMLGIHGGEAVISIAWLHSYRRRQNFEGVFFPTTYFILGCQGTPTVTGSLVVGKAPLA